MGSHNFKGTTSSVFGIHCWLQCNKPQEGGGSLAHDYQHTKLATCQYATYLPGKNCEANPTRDTLVLSLCIPIWPIWLP